MAMALVLGSTGLFLHLHLRADLDHAIDAGLRSRAGDVIALVRQADAGLREAGSSAGAPDADFAQIVDERARVFDATPGLERTSLIAADRLPRGRAPVIVELPATPSHGPTRLLATPVSAQERRLVVIVGASLRDRDRALADLRGLLLVGGPSTLLLASLAGYALAAAALRPVESMRRRADLISAEDLDRRLPLPAVHDELRRLGQTLNAMLDRLEGGIERERAFTADASHELRTPLTILRTELELMARDRPSETELDTAVQAAIDETERLARIVDDLLVLARSERDGIALRARTLPVADTLEAMRLRFAAACGDRPIEVDAAADLRVSADADLLERAVSNMLDNALVHGNGPVSLAAEALGGLVELHVRDRGPGFPPGFLPHAFERFARSHPARSERGAGLGLAIVEAIARRHCGSAHASNRDGGGADVWIEIPGRHVSGAPPARGSDASGAGGIRIRRAGGTRIRRLSLPSTRQSREER